MYHTTSRVLVNGKDSNQYAKKGHPLMNKVIDSCPNFEQVSNYINKLCVQQLQITDTTSDAINSAITRTRHQSSRKYVNQEDSRVEGRNDQTEKSMAICSTSHASSTQ